MKIYESFGKVNLGEKKITFAVQTTQIGFDTFIISQYHDISSPTRFALLAILETEKGNDKDLSACKPDCALIVDGLSYDTIMQIIPETGDKKIADVTNRDVIHLYVHHAIGFDPTNIEGDREFVIKYKTDTETSPEILAKTSPPGKGGKGVLIP